LLLILLLYSRIAASVYRKAWWGWPDVYTCLTDAIEGTSVVKALSKEREELSKFVEKLRGVFISNATATAIEGKYFPFMDLLIITSGVAVLFIGGFGVVIRTLSHGALMTISAYMGLLYGPFFGLISLSHLLQQTKTSAERVLEILMRY